MNKIMEMKFGSHLYGTDTPTSDIDLKSIYIPDGEDILMQRVKGSISIKRSKGVGEKNYAGEIDEESYSIQNFMKLVSEGQTVALDVLFASEESIISKTPIWDVIVRNRHRLISRKSEAFIGYCRQQAKKYGIKGSRVAAARETLTFLRALYNDTRYAISMKTKLGECAQTLELFAAPRDFVEIVEIEQPNGNKVKFLEVCGRKLSYQASIANAVEVTSRLVDEYGTRALMAERNEGVDWKALSHAVRIGEQAIELFQTENIVFPRPNKDALIAIKTGQLPYKVVAEMIEDLFVAVEKASAASTLPASVDQEWIDGFVSKVHFNSVLHSSDNPYLNIII
jgi:predicted nucleotidyltransferase